MSASAVYEGWVRHRRFEPVEHAFRYRLFLMYLDLDELPGVLDPFPLFSARRPAPARFRRRDFMGDPDRALAECARDVVARPPPVIAQAARCACWRACATSVTPSTRSPSTTAMSPGENAWRLWSPMSTTSPGESVILMSWRAGPQQGAVLADELDKKLHVSPLMGMDQTYSFRASEPGERLAVQIESRPDHGSEGKTFDATLSLRRRELSAPLLGAMLARYPALSAQVVAKIYAQTLRLRLKGARYFPHPDQEAAPRASSRHEVPPRPQRRVPGPAPPQGRADRGARGWAAIALRPTRCRAAGDRDDPRPAAPGGRRCAAASGSARPTSTASGRPTTSSH